ncbi:MAG: Glu-tRNA(Gln) amidotransferase subunit GatE [Candidatus Cloacimonetes bacterium]|nr:Glu-tRNA(Gln) amidotransferase subunit GatE [Candidatus Cloacimonadota bacterium]MCF7869123.1 Glu-tRNA(Gln) amidotransferase subunit GatE [Candidatus Cloacimonadota bacterium]MCF7884541.1 Glu-tRNA(Gln) amidotransferase subunit GatE [Candidatus Cloacimonadota bacterium]
MKKNFDAKENYELTKKKVGYIPRKKAKKSDYEKLGFKSGLEVHQQLKTKEKLFCHCPVGIYQDFDDYDAELIRHMRPTLSEMGTYDGTALMEFKTRKNIIYRIKNETTCTYEVDDTPPFPINREALEFAIEVSLLLKQNIVGELHITRKQYLDGSIPTGFQRTAIVGIEGEIPLKNKKVRIIQLSLEEDSCREVSDIGHERIYTTDRLGIPLIETVTYPDMKTPDEVKEAGQVIRFINRSSNRVRVGIGAGRQDTNVSISGGTRVEIKGVSHISWLPELTHNEAFRQQALLNIKKELHSRVSDPEKWKPNFQNLNFDVSDIEYDPIKKAMENEWKLVACNLPEFKGILSHFLQPEKTFADELEGRLKVVACLDRPNMIHSEDMNPVFNEDMLKKRSKILGSKLNDAQIVFWAAEEDVQTAMETIEERCRMAFEGVPNETRKALSDGTTIFERVLPGADRMYPDTDSAPIPIEDEYIETLRKRLPNSLEFRFKKLKKWKIPEDCHTYILRNNLMELMEMIINELKIDPKFLGTLLGHKLKHIEGQYESAIPFKYKKLYKLINYVQQKNLTLDILPKMLEVIYQQPRIEMDSILNLIKFEKHSKQDILKNLKSLRTMFKSICKTKNPDAEQKWIMGNLRTIALGNLSLKELHKIVVEELALNGGAK